MPEQVPPQPQPEGLPQNPQPIFDRKVVQNMPQVLAITGGDPNANVFYHAIVDESKRNNPGYVYDSVVVQTVQDGILKREIVTYDQVQQAAAEHRALQERTGGLSAPVAQTLERIIEVIDNKTEEGERFTQQTLAQAKKEADAARVQYELDYPKNDEAGIKVGALTPEQERNLDVWTQTPEGKQTVATLTEAVVYLLEHTANKGLPGHDKRHLVKDLLHGLRFAQQEGLQGYKTLFLISSALHDFGRLAEEALYGKSGSGYNGTDHPKVSHFYTKQILDSLGGSLPKELKDQLLFAVLVHQDANNFGSYITQATQRADRMELLVPSMAYRCLGYDVGQEGIGLGLDTTNDGTRLARPIPGKAEDKYFLPHLGFYLWRLHPNVGDAPETKTDEAYYKALDGAFIMLASNDAEREHMFAAELARDRGALETFKAEQSAFITEHTRAQKAAGENPLFLPFDPMPEGIWSQAKALVQDPDSDYLGRIDARVAGKTVHEIARELLSAPGATVTEEELARVNEKLQALDPDAQERLRKAFAFAIIVREQEDARDDQFLREMQQQTASENTSTDVLLHRFSQFADEQIRPHENQAA